MDFNLKDMTVQELRYLWDNAGAIPGLHEPIELRDVLATTSAPVFFPRVIENIVREAVEPLLVATNLLTPIKYSYGTTLTFPAMGALTAADIAEGQEYPETGPSIAGGTMTATIGKVGLALKVTDEMIRFSQFDIISMLLRQAGYALARHKEVKCFDMIRSLGTPVFDNLNPTRSVNGVTHGRDMYGAPNGSVIMDDIFDAYAHLMAQGYLADTILMHPLSWLMWVKDPVLRSFVQQNGGGNFFAGYSGNPAGTRPWSAAGQGGVGAASGQNIVPGQTSTGNTAPHGLTPSTLLEYPQTLSSAPQLPSYFNVPFKIIVSPFVPFDAARKLTDIYMFQSGHLGALVIDEPITTEEWNDPARDIMKIKLRERYALQMFDEGQAAVVLKNVKVIPNEIVLPAQATVSVSSGWQNIDESTPLAL